MRLAPGSWATPMGAAQVCRELSPSHALYYWQIALERSGWRRDELFGRALSDTAGLPGARQTWANYIENHPSLLLLYAQTAPPDEGREIFERWLQDRAASKELGKGEIAAFYRLAKQWASVEQIERWIALHPERRSQEYLQWAELLHAREEDERAWSILETAVPEPDYPAKAPSLPIARLEMAWANSPESVVNAQALAHARTLAGNTEGFREKAAHLLARSGETAAAVALLLREK
ncbi:MAG: hypothetical protein EOP84_31550 [Verrucomicrobiaceae bacterium]|nr:MAG: hypothetical protein EOP84_31550 [Verrucomicrobiaceae bacterium]